MPWAATYHVSLIWFSMYVVHYGRSWSFERMSFSYPPSNVLYEFYMHVNIKKCMGVCIKVYTYISFHMHILFYSQLSKTFSAKQYFTENFHFLLFQENENLKYKVLEKDSWYKNTECLMIFSFFLLWSLKLLLFILGLKLAPSVMTNFLLLNANFRSTGKTWEMSYNQHGTKDK